MESPKLFAVIPAAGQSKRMGRSKLLMPWQQRTVIDAVLEAWTSSGVDKILLIVRAEDHDLIAACQKWDVEILTISTETADMKATIVEGLKQLSKHHLPNESDGVLIAPADLPRISCEVIDSVVRANVDNQIVVPYYGQKRGHPIRIPWRMTAEIHALGSEQGLDSFLEANPVHRIELDPEFRPRDIDTPEDYEREIKTDRGSSSSRSP